VIDLRPFAPDWNPASLSHTDARPPSAIQLLFGVSLRHYAEAPSRGRTAQPHYDLWNRRNLRKHQQPSLSV
jgi:hypothetical protein